MLVNLWLQYLAFVIALAPHLKDDLEARCHRRCHSARALDGEGAEEARKCVAVSYIFTSRHFGEQYNHPLQNMSQPDRESRWAMHELT
jgi:hypothetical protein